MTLMDLDNFFTYHPPKVDSKDQIPRYEQLRTTAKDFAKLIIMNCPDSRERSLAITNLQQSVMWANASIAINENT